MFAPRRPRDREPQVLGLCSRMLLDVARMPLQWLRRWHLAGGGATTARHNPNTGGTNGKWATSVLGVMARP
jgi:hypothetical protein